MLYTSRSQTVTDRRKFFLLAFLNIIFLISITDSAPLNSDQPQLHLEHPEFSPSSQPTSPKLLPEKRTLDGGTNPSDDAWQAWLLFDNAGVTDPRYSSDSANMYRRITPKSIFIAPPLPSCPDGYQSDGMNRCVKDIQIDQNAHINFLLERLNAMYANLGQPKPAPEPEPQPPPLPSSSSSSSSSSILSMSQPQVSGPFQLNIPLVLDTTKNDTDNGNSNDKIISSDDEETIVTVYEVKDTKKEGSHEEKDEKIFLVENQNTKVDNNDKITANEREKFVPIVEFVQETDSNITSIVDYNVPVISMSQIRNRTELIDDSSTENHDKNVNDDRIFAKAGISNNSSGSSTVVLVLTPSELPLSNITKQTSLPSNASTEQEVISIENDKKSTATKIISHDSSQDIKTFFTPIKIFFNESETNNESGEIEVTTRYSNDEDDIIDEIEETTPDDEDEIEEEYVTTEHSEEDFDASTESEEEILKHSEAGLSVTVPTIRIKVPLSSPITEQNVSAPNVTSVVIIHDDFIRETTLLGVNSNRSVNISKDSKFNNDKTSIESQNKERVVVVTPKSRITTEMTPKITVYINNSNDEESTESSTIAEKLMTESLEVETITPITTQIDEISLYNSDNINPVVTIEEALMDEAHNHQRQRPSTETFKIMPSNSNNDEDISGINKEKSDSSEMMTASSTNMAKIVFPRDEIRAESPSTPLVDKIHSVKYIRASSPPRFNIIKNNISTTPSVNNNKQVYGYDSAPQHHPNHHTDVIDENRPNIKVIDDHRTESNINRPIIETTYNQRFGSNKNQNQRNNFFPSNFDRTFIDSTRSHVIFPTHKRQDTRPGTVRFPTEEANSIHTSDDLKEKYNRPLALSSNTAPIRTGMGGSKQSNWRMPLSWRSDRQRPVSRFRSITNEQRQRVRSPMLMKFWTKMPLVKDPSLLYHPTYPTVVPVDTVKQRNYEPLHSSRMANFYNEMSAYDQTRTFAQQSETIV